MGAVLRAWGGGDGRQGVGNADRVGRVAGVLVGRGVSCQYCGRLVTV